VAITPPCTGLSTPQRIATTAEPNRADVKRRSCGGWIPFTDRRPEIPARNLNQLQARALTGLGGCHDPPPDPRRHSLGLPPGDQQGHVLWITARLADSHDHYPVEQGAGSGIPTEDTGDGTIASTSRQRCTKPGLIGKCELSHLSQIATWSPG
jgi:hypothetical protein